MVHCIVGTESLDGTNSYNPFLRYISEITSLIEKNSAMYSLSLVDRAISVISLEHHMIGQLAYEIT